MAQRGVVLYGMNNIFTVRSAGMLVQCRIKGKVLRDSEAAYNPLAPGDSVEFEPSRQGHGEGARREGMILRRERRRNSFVRWNRKREAPQTVAANLDAAVCVASLGVPPFRPRFVDRVLIAAAGIPALIVVNKEDLSREGWEEERIEGYRRTGYDVFLCSALSGAGIAAIADRLRGRRTVFVGQSGVGKSSLLNRLMPGRELEIGEVSQKYDRGRHTTKTARLYQSRLGEFIDTPGIRQLELAGVDAQGLDRLFPEFLPYLGGCAYGSCSHRQEPDCSIKEAVGRGEILADRYESYLRIYDELKGRDPYG